LEARNYKLPAAQYTFYEQICSNPDCRCGDVCVSVFGSVFSGELARLVISLPESNGEPKVQTAQGAPQSEYTPLLMRLLQERLKRDPNLVRTFCRHYELVKKRAVRDAARSDLLKSVRSEFV
jgi:hypothetical protein